MAADVMWRAASLLAKKKPLIVSMGTVAASGGYYIACAASEIYAAAAHDDGLIGVFYGKADLSGLLQKIGVNFDTYKTTHARRRVALPPVHATRRAGARRQGRAVLRHVPRPGRRGPHMTKEEVDAVGEGRVWTGQEASIASSSTSSEACARRSPRRGSWGTCARTRRSTSSRAWSAACSTSRSEWPGSRTHSARRR